MPEPTDGDEAARLVRAAWSVLERSGFEGFKIHLLLRETGLSARTFYRHFADKEALLLTLLQDEYARSGKRLRGALATSEPAARVAAWIGEIVGAAGDPRRAARARLFTSLPGVLRRFPDELDAAARLVIDPLETALSDGCADGTLPLAHPAADAQLIHDLAGAALAQALAHPDTVDTGELAAAVTDFALRALGHVERGAEPTDER